MLNKKSALLVLILVTVLVATSNATVFRQMSYQGILTDNAGNRIDGDTTICFKIYGSENGMDSLWRECQSIDIDSGIVNVVLGSINPINLDGTQQYWLAIRIAGDSEMSHRIKLTAVPYSMNADYLDGFTTGNSSGQIPLNNGTKNTDLNADLLDGLNSSVFSQLGNSIEGSEITDGTIGNADISASANISASKISDGSGSGLDADLLDGLNSSVFSQLGNSIEGSEITDGTIGNADISASANISASKISDGSGSGLDADKVDGIHASSTPEGNRLYPLDAAACFRLTRNADLGVIEGVNTRSSGIGVRGIANDGWGVCGQSDNGRAVYGFSINGYAIYGGGYSLFTQSSTYPTARITNTASSIISDALYVESHNTNNSGTDALDVHTKKGCAIYAYKNYADDMPTVWIKAPAAGEVALYVWGDIQQSGTKSGIVKTSGGDEAVFCIESPEVEFYSNGTAQLSNGKASVVFGRLFSEAISPNIPVRVTATPVGSWSGLYLIDASYSGFTVRSETGDLNASFNWIAIGRRKSYEQKPQINVSALEEKEVIRQQKEAEMRQED